MRINFSSKTKGSRKITPFYTIKAGKSGVCKMTKMLIKKWAKHWSPFYISAAWYRIRLFSLFCAINLVLLPQRGMLQAVDIHLGLELIVECASFLVMIWGNPPHSPLLEHVPAMAVMLDCLGHIFPFISPGTEMDVGQAPQPGETPLCAARNTCPAVRRHPQSLPGQGGAPSLSITLSPSHRLRGPRRSKMRRNLRDRCSQGDPPPKTAFRNQKSNYKLLTWRKNRLLIF